MLNKTDLPELEDLSHPANVNGADNFPTNTPNVAKRIALWVHKLVKDTLKTASESNLHKDRKAALKISRKEDERYLDNF